MFGEVSLCVILSFYEVQVNGFAPLLPFDGAGVQGERGSTQRQGCGQRVLVTPAGPTFRSVGPPWSGSSDVRPRIQLG